MIDAPADPLVIAWKTYCSFTILPNTAGCFTADDAVRTPAPPGPRAADDHKLVKLEVLGEETFYPGCRRHPRRRRKCW